MIQFSTPHILDETRWLRDGRFAYGHIENMIDEAFAPFTGQFDGELPYLYVNAKSDFWFINWIEHAAWGLYKVHPREDFGTRFLPAFERDVRGQLRRYDTDGDRLPKLGGVDTAFYATGMEYQPAFYFFTGDMHQDPTTYPDIERTDFTAYWYGNARAMAEMENHFGDRSQAREFETLAAEIQSGAMSSMWHDDDGFFYDQREEDNEPARVAQVVGFFPFAFQLPPVDRLDTLRIFDQLIDPEAFWAPYPVSTISRKSAFFSQTSPGGCCHWNGPTWPFANTVVLNAVAEAVKGYGAAEHRQTFWDLLQAFTHEQFEGDDLTLPLVSESLNGDTGDWKSQVDSYFHSAWIDPVVRHVVGLTPRADDKIELQPIPNDWPYFALTRLSYHGRSLTVVWDAPDDADHFDDDWEGLAVWDGTTLLFSQERLEHVIFDPASGEVVTP